jgi:hypothetical protein
MKEFAGAEVKEEVGIAGEVKAEETGEVKKEEN